MVKLWRTYHLVSIILYCIYQHHRIVCVMCIDCILVLTVASSSLVTHLAICKWLHYLHFLCWCFTLARSYFFLLHWQDTCLCVFHFFYCNCLHVGYPLVVISTTSIKWKWQSYRRELSEGSKWKGNAYLKCNRKKESKKYGNFVNNADYYECLCVRMTQRIMQ
jgi:hypothetical protein